MQKHMKPGTPQAVPSKALIINWVRSLFPELPQSLKIEQFGEGVIYARILNHYHGNPLPSKIAWNPKNQYQYSNNLRHVQAALTQFGITMPLDVNRISKCKFLQNWVLINGFYRHFHQQQQPANPSQENLISNHGNHNNGHIKPKSFHRPPTHHTNHEQQMRPTSKSQLIFTHPPSLLNPANLTNPSKQQQYQMVNSQFSSLAQSSLQLTNYLKQNISISNNSPSKGKWSVGSQMLSNNNNAVIDRIKQILLKGSQDAQKVRQIKMLLGMPIQQEEVIKIQDDDNSVIVYGQTSKLEQIKQHQENNKESVSKLSNKKLKKPFKI